MRISPNTIVILWMLFSFGGIYSQEVADSLTTSSDSLKLDRQQKNDYQFGYKNLIIPGACVLYGVLSLKTDALADLNESTADEVNEEKPKKLIWDSYAQYAPAVMVYGLNLAGVKGKHNFRDRSIIFLTSQLIATAIVFPTKNLVKERRPDNSNTQSFPSGHTTVAFATAQFMFREYKDKNLLLSLSGYPFAVFTGIYRVVNNRHWVGDVVTGAGVGIFSTDISYWLFPKINHLLGGSKSKNQLSIAPYYQDGGYGIGLAATF